MPRSSPTAYNVFTAYAVNTETLVGDSCSVRSGPTTTLTIGYSEAISNSPGVVTLGVEGEQFFISQYLGLTTCQGQGATVVPAALLQVTYLTPTVSITRTFQSGLTIAPVSFFYTTYLLCDRRSHQRRFCSGHTVEWVEFWCSRSHVFESLSVTTLATLILTLDLHYLPYCF